MKRVLLVATTTGYQIRSFGEAAGRLGVRLVFASDRCDQLDDPWWDQAIPVRFHDEAALGRRGRRRRARSAADGILAVGDRPAVLAARLAQALRPARATRRGGRAPAETSWRHAAALQRRRAAAAVVRAGPDRRRRRRALAGASRYPAVVKPLALSGSRGVMRVNDARVRRRAFDRAAAAAARSRTCASSATRRTGPALVEGFIPGPRVRGRGLCSTTARCERSRSSTSPIRSTARSSRRRSTSTPSRCRRTQDALGTVVVRGDRALGLRHGASTHGRATSTSSADAATRVYVLEVAARPIGGLCSRALRFVSRSGVDPGPATCRSRNCCCGTRFGEDVSGLRRERAASGVMMIPIPRRGVFRRVERRRRGARGRRASRMCGSPRSRTSAARAAARGPELPGIHLCARRGAGAGGGGAARRARRLRFTIDREIPVVESDRQLGRRRVPGYLVCCGT